MSLDQRHVKSKYDAVEIYGSKCVAFSNVQIYSDKQMYSIRSTQKEDEIEEYLRKRYADESVARRHFGDGGEEMSNEITQQTLLPAIK